jgi:hypothetical protein
MAINKDAWLRYRTLDECFRNTGRRYNIDDLVEACNDALSYKGGDRIKVTKRQVYKDIAFMEGCDEWKVEIKRVKDGRVVYFRYENPEFSINNMPLSQVQMQWLKETAESISHFSGLPQFEWLQDTLVKLTMQGVGNNNARIGEGVETEKFFEFESNIDAKGIELLPQFYNAILYKKVLKIKYHPFVKEPYYIDFHTQYLKQHNSRWFAFGITTDTADSIWNLALDRVEDIEDSSETYIKLEKNAEGEDWNWEDYFSDVVGVTVLADAKVEEVEFLVYGVSGKYIETKPIHQSQIFRRIDDQTVDIKLHVRINVELKQSLLTYAPDIKILKPASLAEDYAKILKDALK